MKMQNIGFLFIRYHKVLRTILGVSENRLKKPYSIIHCNNRPIDQVNEFVTA